VAYVGGGLARTAIAAAALAIALIIPAAAQADPFPLPGYTVLGQGQRPDVAVDGVGGIHIVWTRDVPGGTVIEYCKLTTGSGTTCTVRKTFDKLAEQPFESSAPPFVFVDKSGGGDDVIIVLSINGRGGVIGESQPTYGLGSPDGGQTFFEHQLSNDFRIDQDAALARVGTSPFAILALGHSGANPGSAYQAMPIEGKELAAGQLILDSGQFGAGHAVAPSSGPGFLDSPVVVYDRNTDGLLLRGAGQSDYNLANWPKSPLATFGYGSRLAADVSAPDPYLLTGDQDERLTVRHYEPSGAASSPGGFGPPEALSDISSGQQALSQEGKALFAAWRVENEGTGALAYSFSTDPTHAKSFSEPALLAAGGDALTHIEIAARDTSGGIDGAAVFGKTFIGTENSDVGVVRLPPGAGVSGASGHRAGSAAKKKGKIYAVRSDAPIGKGGTVVSLATPSECVKRNSSLSVRAFVSNKHFKLRKKRTKVSRVELALGGRVVADKKSPFGVTISTKGLARGSSQRVKASIFTKRKGRQARVGKQSFKQKICK
jgi:hypothetical protein